MVSRVSGAAGKASQEAALIPGRIPFPGDAARPCFWKNSGQEVRSMPPENPFDTSLGEAYINAARG